MGHYVQTKYAFVLEHVKKTQHVNQLPKYGLIKMSDFLPYNEQACKMCGKANKEVSNTWFVFCFRFGYLEQFYYPLDDQAEFHVLEEKYRLYAGGFGSGKNLCGSQESIQLAL